MITYPLNNIDYTAEDAELYFSTRHSGVYDGDDDFAVTFSGVDNDITVGSGIAWIQNTKFSGKVAALKNPKTLTLDLADPVYDRIDAIVIQFDASKNSSDVIVKKGTASSFPVAPSVSRTESLYELHIFHVHRRAGATTIGVNDVIDQRKNKDYCGVMFDPISAIDETLSKRGFAADAKAVGEKLNNLSGSTMTLLWENAKPTDTFASQNIALDLGGYDITLIAYDSGKYFQFLNIGVEKANMSYMDTAYGNTSMNVKTREVKASIDGVSFYSAFTKFAETNAYWQRDDFLVPYRIYGIKMGGGSSAGVLPSAEGVGF